MFGLLGLFRRKPAAEVFKQCPCLPNPFFIPAVDIINPLLEEKRRVQRSRVALGMEDAVLLV